MTIKWVQSDPLIMNGEPFCHATRLAVRNLLEMRSAGLTPEAMIARHPELRRVGIAEAFRYAAEHRDRYADFVAPDGTVPGPGFEDAELAALPEHLRSLAGIVTSGAPVAGDRATIG